MVLPRLSVSLLADVVKVLPVSWFDCLARILSCVEDFGIWPEGLLDAYIADIPKVDGDATPLVWAQTPAEGAVNLLECALGRYSSSQLWRLPIDFDVEGAARRVAEEPDVWTDGSLVDDRMSGVSSAGAGCFTYRDFGLIGSGVIGMMMLVIVLLFLLVVVSAQTVQRG